MWPAAEPWVVPAARLPPLPAATAPRVETLPSVAVPVAWAVPSSVPAVEGQGKAHLRAGSCGVREQINKGSRLASRLSWSTKAVSPLPLTRPRGGDALGRDGGAGAGGRALGGRRDQQPPAGGARARRASLVQTRAAATAAGRHSVRGGHLGGPGQQERPGGSPCRGRAAGEQQQQDEQQGQGEWAVAGHPCCFF